MKFKADIQIGKDFLYPLFVVAGIALIVLFATSAAGLSSYKLMFIPISFCAIGWVWFLLWKHGSYYIITNSKLVVYSSFMCIEEIFIRSIRRIDQDRESLAGVYRASFIDTGRKSLKLRLHNGERIIISPEKPTDFLYHLTSINSDIQVDVKY